MKIRIERPFRFAAVCTALFLQFCSIKQGTAAGWITNSPLLTARSSHTTTLLANGKLLVAGGWNDGYLSSAELFDPATGKWTATGSMTTNRCYHTATLLPNGKVLVAGGYANGSPNYLSSAELYDPASGTWTNTGSMAKSHVFHTATLLANGKVLVVGGVADMTAAEIYDPASGSWTNTGSLNRGRWFHAAVLLTNGDVLVAGGDYNYLPPGQFSTAEIYSPLTGTWTSTSPMTTNRTSPTATMLPDGQVLVAGGWLMAQVQTNPPAYSSFSLTSAELYDPASGNWTATTNAMTTGRNNHSASLLPNGQVLLVAGFRNGSGDLDSVELFDSATSAWIPATNRLRTARSDHTATLLPSGRLLVVGGMGHDGVTNRVEEYDDANGTFNNTGAMTTAHTSQTAALLPDGKVLVAGGYGSTGAAISTTEIYNPAMGIWTATAPLHVARGGHTITLLPGGEVLVAGGQYSLTVYSSAELYNVSSKTWTMTGGMKVARANHTATVLRNGKVLVVGGQQGTPGVFLASAELYDRTTGSWELTGTLNTGRYGHTATLLPNGNVLVAGGSKTGGGGVVLSSSELYDPATGKWAVTGSLNLPHVSHTATLLPNGKVLVAGGISGSYGWLATAELFDPTTGTWTTVAPMTTAREYHTATLLLDGTVLVVGGSGASGTLLSAEYYDPATGKWTTTGGLDDWYHTATLLPNGNVLVSGGNMNGTFPSPAKLYDVGQGFSAAWQPQIASITSPLCLGDSLAITGSHFRGISGASSGTTQNSSSDYPLVQLRSIESGQTTFLFTTNWSTSSLTSLPLWNFPPGYALATVFVNGISSTSSIVNISVPIPTAPTLTDAGTSVNGSFQFAFTNSVGGLFGVLASTNLTLSLTNWTALGGITEVSPGQFHFTDSQATNSSQRFYRIRSL